MTILHVHLVSDSTGETLENIAKAALAQFDGVEAIKHFWPMVVANSTKLPDLNFATVVEWLLTMLIPI